MTSVVFAIPGDINLPTGGYAYDRRVLALLPQFGVAVRHLALPGGFPAPDRGRSRRDARACCRACRADTVILVDGLAYGAMPAELIAALRSPIVALVHHPLCLEAGLAKARQDELLRAGEGRARARPARHRHQPDHGGHARRRFRRARRTRSPSPSPAPTRPRAPAAPASRCSCWRSARSCRARPSTCWCARSPPCRSRDWRLDHRRPHRPQRAGARGAAGGHRRHRTWATHRARRPGRPASSWTSSMPRPIVFVMPSLYEGYGMVLAEAHGARTADRLHHRRRRCRHRARRRRHQGAARRRAGARRGHRPRARRCRSAPPHERCRLGRRPEIAALGGYGAHRSPASIRNVSP